MMNNVQIQVVQHLRPGGIETMVLELLRCKKAGTEVHVVSLEGSASTAISNWPRLASYAENLHFLNKPSGFCVYTIVKLMQLMRRLRASAVHTHHIGPLLYGGIASRLTGIPRLVHTEHDAWHLQDSHRCRLQRRVIHLLQPRLVADSYLVAEELKKTLPNCNYSVIRNGVDCTLFSPGDVLEARRQLGLPASATLIGCAGRLEPVKGHARLLKAHALLSKKTLLVLAGSGSLQGELKELALNLGTSDRVLFLGHVDDMPNFYRALNVFCLPSDHEGMPLSPLEAQASGVICVVTDVGGTREAVCPETGRIVTTGAPSALASNLESALYYRYQGDPRNYPLTHANLEKVIISYQSLLMPEVQG